MCSSSLWCIVYSTVAWSLLISHRELLNSDWHLCFWHSKVHKKKLAWNSYEHTSWSFFIDCSNKKKANDTMHVYIISEKNRILGNVVLTSSTTHTTKQEPNIICTFVYIFILFKRKENIQARDAGLAKMVGFEHTHTHTCLVCWRKKKMKKIFFGIPNVLELENWFKYFSLEDYTAECRILTFTRKSVLLRWQPHDSQLIWQKFIAPLEACTDNFETPTYLHSYTHINQTNNMV